MLASAERVDEHAAPLPDQLVAAARRARAALPRTQRNRRAWQPYIDAVNELANLAAHAPAHAAQQKQLQESTEAVLVAQRDLLLALRAVGRKHGGDVERDIESVLNDGCVP